MILVGLNSIIGFLYDLTGFRCATRLFPRCAPLSQAVPATLVLVGAVSPIVVTGPAWTSPLPSCIVFLGECVRPLDLLIPSLTFLFSFVPLRNCRGPQKAKSNILISARL